MTFLFGGTSSAFHHFTLATQIILRGPRKCEQLITDIGYFTQAKPNLLGGRAQRGHPL